MRLAEWRVLQQVCAELEEAHVSDIDADGLRVAIMRYRRLAEHDMAETQQDLGRCAAPLLQSAAPQPKPAEAQP